MRPREGEIAAPLGALAAEYRRPQSSAPIRSSVNGAYGTNLVDARAPTRGGWTLAMVKLTKLFG
jgi:hypothetical protein